MIAEPLEPVSTRGAPEEAADAGAGAAAGAPSAGAATAAATVNSSRAVARGVMVCKSMGRSSERQTDLLVWQGGGGPLAPPPRIEIVSWHEERALSDGLAVVVAPRRL